MGDVTIKVAALNLGAGGTGGANASAVFSQGALPHLSVTGLDVEADASSAGGHNAFANAYVNIHETGTASISHGVTVRATAVDGSSPGNAAQLGHATANAQFILDGATKIELGDLTISADATNYENGQVHAIGSLHLDPPTSVTMGDVTIKVAALNLGAGGTGGANASAVFSQGALPHLSVTGLDIEADAASHGGHGAFANALANMADSDISILHDVTVRANAFNGGGAGNAVALAHLDLEAGPSALALHGGVDVTALANEAGSGNAEAKASATLSADVDEVSVTNAILVGAWAEDAGGHLASANAILHVQGTEVMIGEQLVTFGSSPNSTHANVGIFVGAFANDGHAGGEARSKASANIFASNGEGGYGNVTVGAAAIISASAVAEAGSANAQARFHVNGANVAFDGGTDRINSEIFSTSYVGVKVVASASDHADGVAVAVASGDIFANHSLNITRRVLDSAYANNPVGGGNASAMASLTLKASHGDVTIHDSTIDGAFLAGSIFVNANANDGGASYNAIAHAVLKITALSGDAIASGSVGVDAHASRGIGGGIASAGAFATLEVAHELSIGGSGLFVSANAHGAGGQQLVLARAIAHLRGSTIRVDGAEVNAAASAGSVHTVQAVASFNAAAADDVEIFGGFGVHAVASGFNVRSDLALAEANLKAGGTVDILYGDVDVTASASSDGTRDGRAISVKANAQLAVAANDGMTFGTLYTNGSGQHVFGGDITVTANERSDRAANGSAIAHANLHASTVDGLSGGALLVYGNVLVEADANGQSRGENIEALASMQANAHDEASFAGNITVLANALDSGDGNVTAISKLRLFASSIQIGDVLANHNIGGHVLVEATANGLDLGDSHNVMALASFKGTATSGSINISAPVKVTADALSTRDGRVVQAVAELDLTAESNALLPGAIVLADAVASGFVSYVNAQADLDVSAGRNVDVTHNGLFAQANASASSAGQGGTASALIQVNGGHDVFIDGNVDAIAVVLSNHSSNLARALIDIEAGTEGSGSITMVSNIEAIALADPRNDVATAGVTLNAEDNILVFGQDPIADAHAGDGTTAFLQTHFTTNLTRVGSSSTANAYIHITAGGTITFINELNNDQVGALRALASDYPNTNSGSLTAIELLINGLDCGVLGSAGAANGKGEACAKSAFNIEGSDTLP
jgi:hypothetical protein